MRIKQYVSEWADGSKRTTFDLLDVDDLSEVAETLTSALSVSFTKKLDGLDQSYWDFVYNEASFTLHWENFVGLSIYPVDTYPHSDEVRESLADIQQALTDDMRNAPRDLIHHNTKRHVCK